MARSSRTVDHQDVCKARRDLKSMSSWKPRMKKALLVPGSNGSLKPVFTLFTLKVISNV